MAPAESSPPAAPPADISTGAAPSTAGVPLGLGLGRLTITLDGPRSRSTDREVETISGSVSGGMFSRLVLYANGVARDMSGLAGSSFELPVTLSPGLNHLRVVAMDARGMESDDAVIVEYVPPPVERVVLTAPLDGHSLGADAPPFVVVEGKVDDASVKSVAIVANDRRAVAPVEAGHFRHLLPVTAPDVRVWAEAVIGGQLQKSRVVSINGAASASASLGAVVIAWPAEATGVRAEVTAAWRANPGRLDMPGQSTTLGALGPDGPAAPGVFYLRNLRPGVYTFVLRYQAPGPVGEAAVSLMLPDAGGLVTRRLAPVKLGAYGRAVIARVLFPEGILWEQDDWFTGQSQSTETITKFKLPEGVTWTERKADLR